MKPYTKTRPFSLLVASFLRLGVACSPVIDQPSVTIKGSDTMVGLVQRWAEVCMEQSPDSKPLADLPSCRPQPRRCFEPPWMPSSIVTPI